MVMLVCDCVVKVTGGRPATVAVAVEGTAALGVQRTRARPAASVTMLLGKMDPLSVVHATVVPGTPLPRASTARTTNGSGSAKPAVAAVCPSPDTFSSATAGPAAAWATKVTGCAPGVMAVRVAGPAIVGSVHWVVASPSTSVTE